MTPQEIIAALQLLPAVLSAASVVIADAKALAAEVAAQPAVAALLADIKTLEEKLSAPKPTPSK